MHEMAINLPVINMFWDGPNLGAVHGACVRSFLRHGHTVVMHCYETPSDLPEGVEIFDATEIMPRRDLIANKKTGSVSLGTNRYRYRLLRAGMGIYADCDMYCLCPIIDDEYIFGWEDSRQINGAVLKYPADSPLADMLVAATETEYHTPDELHHRRGKYVKRVKHALGRGIGVLSVRDMPWGVWGPRLLTQSIRTIGLEDKAKPIDSFYPLHYFNTALLFEPGLRIEDLVTPRTQAIHLCHKLQDERPPPAGSPLQQIIAEP